MLRLLAFCLTLLCLLVSRPTSAQFNEDVSLSGGLNALRVAVPFLLIAPDSRAGALGDAGVASSPDINSQHWNPAKYAFMQRNQGIALSYTPWLRNLIDDINLTYLAGYYRIDNMQVISASLLYFSMGEITFTQPDSPLPAYYHNANEFAFDLGYSRKFSDYISGGLAFRYIRSDLTGGFSHSGSADAQAGNAVAADLSVYYQKPIVIENRNSEMAFGINISNIGSKISYNDDQTKDFIPINMRTGGRLTMNMDDFNSLSFILDLNKLLVPTPPIYVVDDNGDRVIVAGRSTDVAITTGMIQSFYDAPGGWREELNEISYAGGIEYWYSQQFAIRAGYFDEHSTKGNRKYFSIGAGLKYNVLKLDFAYLIPRAGQANPMANTVRFSLSFDFEPAGQRGRSPRR